MWERDAPDQGAWDARGLPLSITQVSTSLVPDTQASWGVKGLRLERVARLERLLGLGVHLEDEVALYNVTAVDPRMGVTARASARCDLYNRRHGGIARRKIDGAKDGALDTSLLCDG